MVAKGKGVLNTFWLESEGKKTNSDGSPDSVRGSQINVIQAEVLDSRKQDRLVEWMAELLGSYISKIVSCTAEFGIIRLRLGLDTQLLLLFHVLGRQA